MRIIASNVNTHTFRANVFLPILDTTIGEINRRFSSDTCSIMTGIQSLNPKSKSFLDLNIVKQFASRYGIDEDDLLHEIHQTKRLVQRKTEQGLQIGSLQEFAQFMEPYSEAFFCLFKLIKIAMVLPVNTASCERSFSMMRIIKTYLRNSMGDDRLSNLAVLSIASSRAKSLELEIVVDEFDNKYQNRRIALH